MPQRAQMSPTETQARIRFQSGPKIALLVLGIIITLSVILLVGHLSTGSMVLSGMAAGGAGTQRVSGMDPIAWALTAVWAVSTLFFIIVLFARFIGPPEKLVHYLLMKSRKLEVPEDRRVPDNWSPWFNVIATVFDRTEVLSAEVEKGRAELDEKVNLIRRFSWVFERNEELTAEVEKKNRELEVAVEKYRLTAEELKKHRDHLEERVSERTLELSIANNKLKDLIERANEMAEKANAANKAKTQFLANMSHEIRTPLNAIIGFTDMMLQTRLDEDQQDYANTTRKSSEALFGLLNNILDFSKIEAGELDLDKVAFDPELLAFDVCDVIRPRVSANPVSVICRISDTVPQTVIGDPGRFRQVLTNLMGNASKFTRAGEIELSLEIAEETPERVKLQANVRDTGIGIPGEKLDTIFNPFQQADESMTREYGGTGLGLAISRQIAHLMGGDVWVESRVGAGSTFHFAAWVAASPTKAPIRRPPASFSGKKILVLDGSEAHREILVRGLESAGAAVSGVGTGPEAIEAFKQSLADGKKFDLGIMDIHAPGADGCQMASAVRSLDPSLSEVPLIALSASLEREGQKCRKAGFYAFLPKPFPMARLFQLGERLLSREGDISEQDALVTRHSVREEIKQSIRILLVEDNPVNQKLTKTMLTKAGYQVDIADNGKIAVEKFTAVPRQMDLILMDVQMPEMDGIEATRRIREVESVSSGKDPNRKIPIIALTAHAMKGDRELCLDAGMDDYLTKPIKREVILEILKKWISGIDLAPHPG